MNVSNNKNKMKKKFLTMALFLSMLSAITMQTAFAGNTTATATLGGNNTVTGAGTWTTGLALTGSVTPNSWQTAKWTNVGSSDYGPNHVLFIDNNSAADGAYLSVSLQNAIYTYTGAGTGNTGLLASTRTFIYPSLTAAMPTKGADTTTKNVNIISAQSCSAANNTALYTFHTGMKSATLNYRLGLTTSNQVLFRTLAASECTSTVKLGFRQVQVGYPALTTAGSYANTIVLTATDGTP